jgi:hypothetical protein
MDKKTFEKELLSTLEGSIQLLKTFKNNDKTSFLNSTKN